MRSRRLSYGVAALLWLATVFELALIPIRAFQGALADVPVFGRLLTQPEWADRLPPIAILAVLAWVLIDVLLHVARVSRERWAVQELSAGTESALGKIPATLRAGRRAKLVLEHRGSPDYLYEALPAVAAVDAGGFDNAYSLTKAYIWILPVLGFIGTAMGMAHAIGGFSLALGETSEIKVLADRLGQLVIPGLASAFSTTIVALGAAIVGHFCLTNVQAWDAEALDDLDRASIALLAGVPRSAQGSGSGGDVSRVVEGLRRVAEELAQMIGKLDLTEPAAQLTRAAGDMHAAAAQVSKASQTLQDSALAPYHVTITRGNGR